VAKVVRRVKEQGPVRVPKDVLSELEAVGRSTRTDTLDIPTLRYVASETEKPALVLWVDKHAHEYGRGLLDGFQAEDWIAPVVGDFFRAQAMVQAHITDIACSLNLAARALEE
jgi:hypothetical protein